MKTLTAAQLKRQLLIGLKELRLPAMRALHREQADLARKQSLSYEHFLLSLVQRELEERHTNRIERWLRESRLPLEKTMEAFDRSRLPSLLNHHVSVLLEDGFLDRHENVLAFGPPGCGKTHLLCALGIALIHQRRRILFRPCSLLVQDLLAAKRSLTLDRLMKRLRKYDALILDDIGYVQHSREEMEVLFTLLAQLYERGSVMLTSNLAFSDWERIFKDPMTTAAAIDRLVHHCVILEMNLPSYRLEVSKKRLAEAAAS